MKNEISTLPKPLQAQPVSTDCPPYSKMVVIGDNISDNSLVMAEDCGGQHSCGGFCNKVHGHSGKHYCMACRQEF